MGPLLFPLEPSDFAKNGVFWAKSKSSRGGGWGPPANFFFPEILLTLLEHVFGRFSNITPSEPLSLDIAHFYNGISGQK